MPRFLPDGLHFVFYVPPGGAAGGIYLGSLAGGVPQRLAAVDTAAVFLNPDMLLFIRQGTLLAQQIELKTGKLIGEPVRVADSVGSSLYYGGFAVSANGHVAYRPGHGETSQLSWYDRSGKAVGLAGEADSSQLLYTELSPDGQRVAMHRNVQNNSDIWIMDVGGGGLVRFTFDPAVETAPIWSPDGTKLAFSSNRKGPFNLYVKHAGGANLEGSVLETPRNKHPNDWSKDGRFLLYGEDDAKTGRDLLALPVTGNDRKPIPVATSSFDENNGQFSPDGRFVAYETNESGRFEIVVQPFPEVTGRWQVSTNGGTQPRWRPDGKELFFMAPDGRLMASIVMATGTDFKASPAVALFGTNLVEGPGANRHQYAVSKDGRFLLNQRIESSNTSPITIVLNWMLKASK
jgi:Tol biopolymer transport system component